MKNKKIILTSLSFFAFVGMILATNLDNVSKLNSASNNLTSLNDSDIKIANEDSNALAIDDFQSQNSITKSRTSIELSSNSQNIIANNYPFQIENNRSILESLIKIGGSIPTNFNMANDVEFLITGINNLSPPEFSNATNRGSADILVRVNNYIDSNGNTINSNTPNFSPLERVIIIRNFKSLKAPTSYDKISSFDQGKAYASDIANEETNINNFFKLNNAIENLSSEENTKFLEVDRTFDNLSGTLKIEYILKNYIDKNGKYISEDSFITTELSGFKKVPGATSLVLKSSMNKVLPSKIAQELSEDFNSYSKYFDFVNFPDPAPIISGIDNILSDDSEGIIELTLTINGKYFDSNLIERVSSLQGDLIGNTILGFVKPIDNNTPIIVGSTIGGIALIIAIVLAVFFINKLRADQNKVVKNKRATTSVPNTININNEGKSKFQIETSSNGLNNKSLFTSIPQPISHKNPINNSISDKSNVDKLDKSPNGTSKSSTKSNNEILNNKSLFISSVPKPIGKKGPISPSKNTNREAPPKLKN
ncbi:MAG: hypothetical protein ACRDCF_00370 [Mycoplasmoidaceae bacterium]